MNPKFSQPDFLTVALAARRRGFEWLTPVRNKVPRLPKYNTFCRSKTVTELRDMADEFPGHEVGIVMRRGTKHLCWDIDKNGVLDRCVEHARQIGETFPETYTVLTRPVTAPHKRHIFFEQTELSRQTWNKEIHAGDYDIVGTGGGMQVVAEGCVREDTGEVRTGNGLAPVRIPDWLVRWLDEDQRRLHREKRTTQRKVEAEVEEATRTISIPRGDRTAFLKQRAKWLVTFNMQRPQVYDELIRQCRRFCEGGVELTDSPEGQKKIRAVAFDKTLYEGDPRKFLRKERTRTEVTGLKIVQVNPRDARTARVSTLPDEVTAKDAYAHLGLNPTDSTNRMAFSRAMHIGGFVRQGGRREGAVWRRQTSQKVGSVTLEQGASRTTEPTSPT